MNFRMVVSLCMVFLLNNLVFAQSSINVPQPEKFFGFKPGADRQLFDYEQLVDYLKQVDAASDRIQMKPFGESALGKPMYIVFISAPENFANLDRLKEINKELAINTTLSEDKRAALVKEGKVFFLATLSMHSNEVGPSQAAPLIVYELATTDDTEILSWLEKVVFMMIPSHNPDGMDMVVHHYLKYRGTKYEGSSLPGIYHKYVGHDNNRDFITLSQPETKAISRVFSTEWYPQVMVEKHQMGSRSARYFVPPMHDPIAENIDGTVWNWTWVFGSNMSADMTKRGLKGISQHYLFDDYWPGSTETCIWKNTIGMLTEAAGVKHATPIFIEPNELSGYGKGLSEYKKSINMPDPWPGGWWRLGDIVQYEIESTKSILKTSALYHDEILIGRNEVAKKEVEKGRSEPPFYFVLPPDQHDKSEWVSLVNLLLEHGVKIYQTTKTYIMNDKEYPAGSIVVPLAQPIRPFIKEVLEAQTFPERHYTPGGELIKPYDITSWSLPLHRGLKADEIKSRNTQFESLFNEIRGEFSLKSAATDGKAMIFPSNNNESYKAAFWALSQGLEVKRMDKTARIEDKEIPVGSFIISAVNEKAQKILNAVTVSPIFVSDTGQLSARALKMPRIALVETYFHDMDAGWTRYVFDTYHVPYRVVRPGDFKKTDFAKKFDVVIFPDADKNILMKGKYKSKDHYSVSNYPPEYTKGIEKEGMEKLMTFLDKGGIILSWGRSSELFMGPLEIKRGKDKKEEFQLPVRNIAEQVKKQGLYCPGSLLKIKLLPDHPLTYGMSEEAGVFYRGRPLYATSIPSFDMDRRVIATFPEKDILLSGYCQNADKLGNRTVMAWIRKGKGQLVLIGFNPQFRASTQGTFKLLFNALLLKKL
ncbi:MAG TPA: hypothetical protein EYP36_07995 [Calditrichaeota bacterium]|nr:hypothetical protein [Calditrichota bacterium]